MKYEIHHSDCLAFMQTLPDNHVDAIVTDPPYGLSFMGKKWDYDVPSEDIWRECLRVLKPGGHLLAFAGTRTQHRMAVRIEDAGFEIRDMIAWVYGSGFPKSLDVSKAIDKMDASEEQQARRYRFTAWVRSQGVTAKQINQTLTAQDMGRHYTDVLPNGKQPAIMTREHLEQCRHLFQDIPAWVEAECDKRSVESRNFAEREVVGHAIGVDTTKQLIACATSAQGLEKSTKREYAITAPATDAAKQWHGWGTALKPALEPITVARKPLIGTVAENVLTWGTGGVNVDGCRVGGEHTYTPRLTANVNMNDDGWQKIGQATEPITAPGRWPANLIHDGSEEATELLGDAQRFFYCAKASKADRGESNIHPTVKPTELMRYLCRLVTPPNGIVFDPFMGSGSTGKAAVLEGFDFIGCDMTAEYVDIARARIEHAAKTRHNTLFQ